jgi:hypothetical protein
MIAVRPARSAFAARLAMPVSAAWFVGIADRTAIHAECASRAAVVGGRPAAGALTTPAHAVQRGGPAPTADPEALTPGGAIERLADDAAMPLPAELSRIIPRQPSRHPPSDTAAIGRWPAPRYERRLSPNTAGALA